MPASGLKAVLRRRLARPPEPEGVIESSRHDPHPSQPEEQMPDEPTTPIGKKKRKRRTVDKDLETRNPSEHIKTAGDLLYSCNIDKVSETQIVDAVQSINYSIDVLISKILEDVKKSKLSYPRHPSQASPRKHLPTNLKPGSDVTLVQILLDSRLSDHTRDLVVESILHNLITSLLYKHFFDGGHFFGVGSKTLHEYLETMLSKLVAGGNSDFIAIQCWRSMSVEAVFQMNDNIESQLNDELIAELEIMLKIAFPMSPNQPKKSGCDSESESSCESIVCGVWQLLLDVNREARRLSFMVQHEIVSRQLLLTIAPAMQASSDCTNVLGTYSFGLQRVLGSERSFLIETKVITLSSFFPSFQVALDSDPSHQY